MRLIRKIDCMNRFLIFATLLLAFYSCNRPVGEITTRTSSSKGGFSDPQPYGMRLIKKGTFMMGTHHSNRMFPGRDAARQVTVESFYMDETEITNDQYLQFVMWVRDSVAYRELIAAGRVEYEIDDPDSDSIRIRWSQRIRWNDRNEDVQEALASLYYQGDDNLGPRQLNAARMIYRYKVFNYEQAALPGNQFNYRTNSYPEDAYVLVDTAYVTEQGHIVNNTIRRKLNSRNDFYSTKMINIYPDTLTWVNDLRYSFNDPRMKMYFSNPQYADYPVVGVSWEQAQAFCHWRTMMYNNSRKIKGEPFRLPTEAEWEFAAKGRDRNATYPWKGNKLIDEKKNCFLANFKQDRGNYVSDAGVSTKAVKSYKTVPNANGLYDMAGNVAEWTSTAHFSTSESVNSDLNPNFEYNAKADDPANMKRKIVKGGSWKDIPYYLQSGARTYEYQNESRPYIGFRCVRSYKGDVK
jgi:gliding motility-associated lipoprotein GldK